MPIKRSSRTAQDMAPGEVGLTGFDRATQKNRSGDCAHWTIL